jgi:hypothetical protein
VNRHKLMHAYEPERAPCGVLVPMGSFNNFTLSTFPKDQELRLLYLKIAIKMHYSWEDFVCKMCTMKKHRVTRRYKLGPIDVIRCDDIITESTTNYID